MFSINQQNARFLRNLIPSNCYVPASGPHPKPRSQIQNHGTTKTTQGTAVVIGGPKKRRTYNRLLGQLDRSLLRLWAWLELGSTPLLPDQQPRVSCFFSIPQLLQCCTEIEPLSQNKKRTMKKIIMRLALTLTSQSKF